MTCRLAPSNVLDKPNHYHKLLARRGDTLSYRGLPSTGCFARTAPQRCMKVPDLADSAVSACRMRHSRAGRAKAKRLSWLSGYHCAKGCKNPTLQRLHPQSQCLLMTALMLVPGLQLADCAPSTTAGCAQTRSDPKPELISVSNKPSYEPLAIFAQS